MWFVARVDYRALQRRLESHLLLEEVGPLTELEDGSVTPMGNLFADLAGAGVDLTRDEVRRQRVDDPGERHCTVDEVVLMATVRVSLAVGVVLVDHDLLTGREQMAGRFHRPGEDQL